MLIGTFLVACGSARSASCARRPARYVTLVRNTPLVIMFAFFSFVGTQVRHHLRLARHPHRPVRLHLVLRRRGGVADALHLGVRLRGAALRRQRGARSARPRPRAPIGPALRRRDDPGDPAAGVRASVPPLASVQIALLKNTSVAAVFGVTEAVAQMRSFTNDVPDRAHRVSSSASRSATSCWWRSSRSSPSASSVAGGSPDEHQRPLRRPRTAHGRAAPHLQPSSPWWSSSC